MRKKLSLLLLISILFVQTNLTYAATTTNKTTPKKSTISAKHKTIKVTTRRALKAKLLTASRSESLIEAIMRRATSVMGTPYSYGSTGGGSFDCSGFTAYAYKAANIELPHSSAEQAALGIHISKNNLKKGDLVIFNDRGNDKIGHVGIYVGDNKFIHASTSKGVTITSLDESYYENRYVGARRIME